MKGKDNILVDGLSHLQCLELYEKSPLKNVVNNMVLQYLMKVKPFRKMLNQKTLHPQTQIWSHLLLTSKRKSLQVTSIHSR